MNVERQKILELVYASIDAINEQQNAGDRLDLREETYLLGRQSKLDSLSLVTLIVDIEQRLYNQLAMEVSLTDEKAMSQQRSPFLDVRSLTDYICSLEA